MDRGPLQKTILLYLAWLAAIGGALIVMLGDLLPVSLRFVRPDSLFTCLLQCQIFFVIFLWPLFLPVLIHEGSKGPRLLLQIVVLLVFALPLTLLCMNMSDVSLSGLVVSQGRVLSLAAFAAGVFALGDARGWRAGPWYFLGAFALTAGLPYLGFLAHSVSGADLSFLAAVSPFWGGLALAQVMIFGVLAAGLFFAASLLRKEVDALPAAS